MTARLGIDIGLRELRVIEADGRRLTARAEVLLPEGTLQDGMPTPLLTAALRGAIDSAGIRGRLARVAISDTGIAVRDFVMPSMGRKELADAVIFEGRRLLPLDATAVYYAWHAEPIRGGHAIYLAAARRDMIDAIAHAVADAGLAVERIDVKPLALARGAGVADGLVLDWGSAEATVVLIVAGRPRFFRSFLLEASPDDVAAQLNELAFSLNAVVRFMRTAAPNVVIGATTPLHIVGRIAFVEAGLERAQERFGFAVRPPTPTGFKAAPDFPWQAHLTGLGLLQAADSRHRLDPLLGGDARVAA